MLRKNNIAKHLFFPTNLLFICLIISLVISGSQVNSEQEYSQLYLLADFTWSPQYPDVNEKITFRSTSSSNGIIVSYNWQFDDWDIEHGPIVTHTYDKKKTYLVTLTVYAKSSLLDNDLAFDSRSYYIEIGASPFPSFTWSPEEPNVRENISFDASCSRDVNGEIIRYNWSYNELSEPDNVIWMGYGKTLTYRFNEQGNYRVKLAVTDNDNNTNEITKTMVVSILKIDEITGGFRNLGFKITNRGNITAENITWKLYANRKLIIMPLWKIISKTGTINAINPGEAKSVDIGWYRRGFGRITIAIVAEADNAVKITKFLSGFMFGKYVRIPNR